MKTLVFSVVFLFLSATVYAQSLKDVLKENHELYESFFEESQEKVSKEAQELAKLVKESKVPELKEVKAKVSSLEKISKKNSKEKNLQLYSEFISPLVKVVKSSKPEDYEVFYCPMVEKRWIQNVKTNKEVKNVFAQNMMMCGGKDK